MDKIPVEIRELTQNNEEESEEPWKNLQWIFIICITNTDGDLTQK